MLDLRAAAAEGRDVLPEVRRALAAAIDRESLGDNTMDGLFKAAPAFVPDSMAGYTSTTKVGYDAVAAKKLLADAGANAVRKRRYGALQAEAGRWAGKKGSKPSIGGAPRLKKREPKPKH